MSGFWDEVEIRPLLANAIDRHGVVIHAEDPFGEGAFRWGGADLADLIAPAVVDVIEEIEQARATEREAPSATG